MDHNLDESISSSDFTKYLSKVGSLLSVQDVSDWLKYGLQVPDYITQEFASNSITGHDLAEIVADDGRALWEELGVRKKRIFGKIMKGIQMVLLGVGSPPPPPSSLLVYSEGGTSLSVQWSVPEFESIPIHQFRLQMRDLGEKKKKKKEEEEEEVVEVEVTTNNRNREETYQVK